MSVLLGETERCLRYLRRQDGATRSDLCFVFCPMVAIAMDPPKEAAPTDTPPANEEVEAVLAERNVVHQR
jgi:hypothetical protein